MITASILLFLISLIIMMSFLMLMQTRIFNLVKLLILQNIVLTAYILCQTSVHPGLELYLSLGITFIIKVIILPWALWMLVTYLKLTQHIEPLINKPTLQLVGIFLVIFALLLWHQIEPAIGQQSVVSFSLSLANSLLALLLIIFRRNAISQVIGLLILENSIFLLSITLTQGFPWLVELGIGFDVLIGAMIFGLFLIRIRMTHGSLQTVHLEKLKEQA